MHTQIYNFNGLPFLTEEDLILKDYLIATIAYKLKTILHKQNKAWQFHRIEAPCLIPRELINSNYTDDDVWVQESKGHSDIVLKPETTPASYAYMEYLLEQNSIFPPVVVWQVSKSFRREQDQPTKHCRYKEFYQQEFQCLYSADTKNNYQESTIADIAAMFQEILGLNVRIVLSDRLPEYSIKTIDIEVFNGDKWMEICSVSLRKDFGYKPTIKGKEISCLVLEIAIGIERLIYNMSKRTEVLCLTIDNQLGEKS